MNPGRDIHQIMHDLYQLKIIDRAAQITGQMSGTTDGQVHTLSVNENPRYVLKLDNSDQMMLAEKIHRTYAQSTLLPELLYTNPDRTYMVYSYVPGTTHYNRGSKMNWLKLLVNGLLNHYEIYEFGDKWGRMTTPRDSWREFNERSVEGARANLGNLLPDEDYEKVKSLIPSISIVEKKYLLHGDTGVHNFVFHQSTLQAVIDPSPMIGPVIYDFIYAFCSSPDDLNVETLFAAYELLSHQPLDQSRIVEEVILQLYCRIGICVKVHPHDLEEYLKAWDEWKKLIP